MTHEAILDRLQEMIRSLFDDETLTVSLETKASDVDGWDSLEHINLINMIEKRFGIRFRMQEALSFRTVGDIVRCLQDKMA